MISHSSEAVATNYHKRDAWPLSTHQSYLPFCSIHNSLQYASQARFVMKIHHNCELSILMNVCSCLHWHATSEHSGNAVLSRMMSRAPYGDRSKLLSAFGSSPLHATTTMTTKPRSMPDISNHVKHWPCSSRHVELTKQGLEL